MSEDREEWIRWRRGGIGASEVAAIMGLSPYETALDVYADKVGMERHDGGSGPRPETDAMRIGTVLEPAIAQLYQERTGHEIASTQVRLVSRERDYLRATLDAVCRHGRVVEFKTAGTSTARDIGDEQTDELPRHWILQCHAQMMVANVYEMDLAALVGGSHLSFRVHKILRDEMLANLIGKAVDGFWDRVRRGDPPPVQKASDVRHVSLLGDDEVPVIFGDDEAEAWAEYSYLGQQISSLQKQRDANKARIFAALEGHTSALLPSGDRIVRKMISRGEYTVKANSYFQLQFQKGNL